MAIWQDLKGNLHDDMSGEALTLPSWPVGMTKLTTAQVTAAQLALATASQPTLQQLAATQLAIVTGSSGQIMRCLAAGVAVPTVWTAYVFALRAISNVTDTVSTVLPTRPAFVAGT